MSKILSTFQKYGAVAVTAGAMLLGEQNLNAQNATPPPAFVPPTGAAQAAAPAFKAPATAVQLRPTQQNLENPKSAFDKTEDTVKQKEKAASKFGLHTNFGRALDQLKEQGKAAGTLTGVYKAPTPEELAAKSQEWLNNTVTQLQKDDPKTTIILTALPANEANAIAGRLETGAVPSKVVNLDPADPVVRTNFAKEIAAAKVLIIAPGTTRTAPTYSFTNAEAKAPPTLEKSFQVPLIETTPAKPATTVKPDTLKH